MKKISVIFFGTHTFAAQMLQSLYLDSRYEIKAVITQPDKEVGRKKVLTPPPAKIFATEHNIPVYQPITLKQFELPFIVDVGIVAQYGKLIPEKVLEAPAFGCINVHTSLLPKYRGASPIQSAIIAGETETGVTIMNMDKGLDTGDILAQSSCKINPNDLYDDVEKKLIELSGPLLCDTVSGVIEGRVTPKPQNNDEATLCSQFTRDTGKINWFETTQNIYNLYRGLTPWPGIWTTLLNKRLKFLSISPADIDIKQDKPGTMRCIDSHLYIATGDGYIEILMLQAEGKNAMPASSYIQGNQINELVCESES